jgi:hypothetical protein
VGLKINSYLSTSGTDFPMEVKDLRKNLIFNQSKGKKLALIGLYSAD